MITRFDFIECFTTWSRDHDHEIMITRSWSRDHDHEIMITRSWSRDQTLDHEIVPMMAINWDDVNSVLCPHSRCFGSYFDVIFLMYLVSSGFSFKPTSSSSSSSSTQFSQEWACRKMVVKHSIKSNQIIDHEIMITRSITWSRVHHADHEIITLIMILRCYGNHHILREHSNNINTALLW